MGVSERHGWLRVPEHPGDGGQRNSSGYGLTRYGMSKVVQAHVLDPGLPPCQAPEAEMTGLRFCRVPRRWKDKGTPRPRLAGDDGPRRFAQPDRARPGLGFGEPEHIAVDLGPSERQDFALAAAGQQKQADDVGLRSARGPLLDQPVQGPVKPGDLLLRQEPGHLPARVRPDALAGIVLHEAGRHGGRYDLSQLGKRHVGRARRLAAHSVEPALDHGPADVIEAQCAEGGQESQLRHAVHSFAPVRAATLPLRRQPVPHDEIPEQGNGGPAGGASGAKRMRAVQKGPACVACFLHRHQCGRTDGRAYHLPVHGPMPHETAMPGRTNPHAQTRDTHVPDDVFGIAGTHFSDNGIRQADLPSPCRS